MLKKYLLLNRIVLITVISIFLTGCYKEDDYNYTSEEILEHLSVVSEHDSIPADGISSTKLTYKFPIESDESLTSLLLVTSSGKFVASNDDSLQINFTTLDSTEENRIKEVTLISSGNTGNCIVSAYVLDYVKKDTVKFYEAHPTAISLGSETFFISNDSINNITFEANLKSESGGVASSGQNVFFESPIGYGIQNTGSSSSNSAGKAIFQYVFTDTSFVGSLSFQVKTVKVSGDTISAVKTISVID